MTLPEQIDVSNAGQIRETLLSVINRGATSLIADMSATISCDYAFADAVARASRRAILTGTELRLVVSAQIVRRVLSTSGLDRLVAIYPSLESATAARAPAVVVRADPGRPGGPPGDGRATPENGGPQDASTAVAPAMIRQMVDAFQDGVALADDHGTITLANRRLDAMFGYRHDELLGHPVEFLIPSELHDRHRRLRASYGRAPRTWLMGDRARLVGMRQDGTTFPAQVSLSPVPTAAGQFTLAVIRDVTETPRLEDLAALVSRRGNCRAGALRAGPARHNRHCPVPCRAQPASLNGPVRRGNRAAHHRSARASRRGHQADPRHHLHQRQPPGRPRISAAGKNAGPIVWLPVAVPVEPPAGRRRGPR